MISKSNKLTGKDLEWCYKHPREKIVKPSYVMYYDPFDIKERVKELIYHHKWNYPHYLFMSEYYYTNEQQEEFINKFVTEDKFVFDGRGYTEKNYLKNFHQFVENIEGTVKDKGWDWLAQQIFKEEFKIRFCLIKEHKEQEIKDLIERENK